MSVIEALHPGAEHDLFDGFDAVTLAAGELEATFVPELGMVGASLRHAGEELLDRRDGLEAYRETGAVMGIPLLHPWANRIGGDGYELHGRRVRLPAESPLVHRDEHGLPIHGLLAAHPGWRVHVGDADGHAARLHARLDFAADRRLLAAFPFAHELIVDVALTRSALWVTTTVRATGAAPVPIAFGYHPYLRLPGADRAAWEVGLPPRRELALDARGIPPAPRGGCPHPGSGWAGAGSTTPSTASPAAPASRLRAVAGGSPSPITPATRWPRCSRRRASSSSASSR